MIGCYEEDTMALRRLAKDKSSLTSSGCPALYSTDDPARMIAQGKLLDAAEAAELIELLPDETAVAIPTETVLRSIAKYASEQGDDTLAAACERFLIERGM